VSVIGSGRMVPATAAGGGGGSVSTVTSADGSIVITNPAGPTVDLSGHVGTVTSASVVTANGLAGTVATSGTTPAITLSTTVTGLLKGNGTTISAAAAGTDYLAGPLTGDVTTVGEAATLVGTANTEAIIRANTLDQMGSPAAAVSFNSQKMTNLANGSAATDGAAFGQIPVITAAVVTLIGQLNGATTRNVSASAVAGEQTVLTGSTASQTLTLPASTAQVSSPNLVMNTSTQVWTIAAGAGTTVNRNGATGSFNLVPGTFIELILIGTVWYMIRWSLAPPQVFNASGTWVPSGTGDAIFTCLGVGTGGGGTAAGSSTTPGCGGGGGEVLKDWYLGNVTANQTITIAAAAAAGVGGGTCSIGALVVVAGGGAGNSAFGAGGAGGDQTGGAVGAAAGWKNVGSGGGGSVAATAGTIGAAGYGRYGMGGGGGGGLNTAGGSGGGSVAIGTGGAGVTNAGGGGGGGGNASGGGAGSGTTGGAGAAGGANTGGGGGGGGAGSVTQGGGGVSGTGKFIIYQVA
jgi:hypothetical protein